MSDIEEILEELRSLEGIEYQDQAKIKTLATHIEELEAKNKGLEELCEERRQFIVNGVEFGYISVPDDPIDTALGTYERCHMSNDKAIEELNSQK